MPRFAIQMPMATSTATTGTTITMPRPSPPVAAPVIVPASPAPNTQIAIIPMQAQPVPFLNTEPPPARGIRRYHPRCFT